MTSCGNCVVIPHSANFSDNFAVIVNLFRRSPLYPRSFIGVPPSHGVVLADAVLGVPHRDHPVLPHDDARDFELRRLHTQYLAVLLFIILILLFMQRFLKFFRGVSWGFSLTPPVPPTPKRFQSDPASDCC